METLTDLKLNYLQGTKDAIKNALIEKGQAVSSTDTFRSYADKIRGITGGGGVPTGYKTVTFMNGDNVLFERLVLNGDDCPNPVTQGRIETPTKESTPQYNYTHSGWTSVDGGTANSSILKNITEDKVVYSAYTSTVRKYTVTFYDEDGTTVLNTQQVAYGGSSTYTYKKEGYMFVGWTPEPTNITGDLSCIGAWQESYAFADAPWSYIAQVSESGQASEVFALGDTRTETLTYADGTTEDVELMIASFDLHPDSNNKPTITLINKQLLSKETRFMSSSSDANGGINEYPRSTALKPFLEDTVIPAFSSDLQSVLRESLVNTTIFNDKYYYKISPLTMENVGLTTANQDGGNDATRLYSFDGTAAARKRTIPNGLTAKGYWLYNGYTTSSSKYAGWVIANEGRGGAQLTLQPGCILFKIFV